MLLSVYLLMRGGKARTSRRRLFGQRLACLLGASATALLAAFFLNRDADIRIVGRNTQQMRYLLSILDLLYDKLAASEMELPILIDTDAFREVGFEGDLWDTRITLTGAPRQTAVKEILRSILAQFPSKNAAIRVHFFVEITTVKRAETNEVHRLSHAAA
jgi:hypothetical protein